MEKDKATTAAVPLSLCIVTNRFDAKLEEIVRACAGVCAELLIGYNGPEENIPALFTEVPQVRIISLPWEGYSITKNKLAAQAAHSWILSLDGDEVPDHRLLKSIAGLPYSDPWQHTVYAFKRLSFFEGKKIQHGAWGRDKVLRLYHRGYTQWNQDIVHEALELKPGTHVVLLEGMLLHYTADDYVSFLEKNKRYARLSADKYFQQGKNSPAWKRLFSPAFTFLREYLLQGGFLDGKAGLNIARINAMYTYWKYIFLKEKYQESSS
jgi:hypothetical protein